MGTPFFPGSFHHYTINPGPCQSPCPRHVPRRRRIYLYQHPRAHAPGGQGSGGHLKGNIEERACQMALYIIENRTTVRAAARKFNISKSTVHKDLSERLPAFNRPLYLQVKRVLEENKAQRHIRGGIATRKKYKGE